MLWRHGVPAPEPQWKVPRRARAARALGSTSPGRSSKAWLEFDGREKYVKYLKEGESVVDAVLREKAAGVEDRRAHRVAVHPDHLGGSGSAGARRCPDQGVPGGYPTFSSFTPLRALPDASRPLQRLGSVGVAGEPAIRNAAAAHHAGRRGLGMMGGMTETKPIHTWLTDMDGVLVHEEIADPGCGEFIDRPPRPAGWTSSS